MEPEHTWRWLVDIWDMSWTSLTLPPYLIYPAIPDELTRTDVEGVDVCGG